MLPSSETQLTRLAACRSDLLENGIDLARADLRTLSQLVTRHLDYLQLMLGWDADVREIVGLIGNPPGGSAHDLANGQAQAANQSC
jgi:hypothetical protein